MVASEAVEAATTTTTTTPSSERRAISAGDFVGSAPLTLLQLDAAATATPPHGHQVTTMVRAAAAPPLRRVGTFRVGSRSKLTPRPPRIPQVHR